MSTRLPYSNKFQDGITVVCSSRRELVELAPPRKVGGDASGVKLGDVISLYESARGNRWIYAWRRYHVAAYDSERTEISADDEPATTHTFPAAEVQKLKDIQALLDQGQA